MFAVRLRGAGIAAHNVSDVGFDSSRRTLFRTCHFKNDAGDEVTSELALVFATMKNSIEYREQHLPHVGVEARLENRVTGRRHR